MNILRSASSRVCLYLVGVCFFLTANTFVFFGVINADNIKQTFHDEGVYSKLVPAVLSTAQYGNDQSTIGQLPLREPWVQEAAIKAFPASDLEQKGNAAIDGTFNYLEGQTAEPEFKLDFSANKQQLAEELGQNAETRLSSLPRCKSTPSSIDAFTIDCLPFGISPSTIGDQLTTQYAGDQRFLKNPVITPDTLSEQSVTGTGSTESPTLNLDGLRNWYQLREVLLWILPIATIVLASLGVYLAADRRRALRILARSLMASAVGLAVFAILISFAIGQGIDVLNKEAIARDIASPVILHIVHQARTIYLVCAAVGVIIALGLFIINRRLLRPTSQTV